MMTTATAGIDTRAYASITVSVVTEPPWEWMRCHRCSRPLARHCGLIGSLEIKCRSCKSINILTVRPTYH